MKRRAFLTALATGIGSVCASNALAMTVPGSYEKSDSGLNSKRWAMVIDTRQFSKPEDYRDIINACHKTHNVPKIDGPQNIKWLWIDKYEHCFPDDLNEHLPQHIINGHFPLLCNHCTNPPCVRVCPTGATYVMDNGIVAMDYHRCIGCRFCMAGCPYGARSFNFSDPRLHLPAEVPNPTFPTRMMGVVEKCTFCSERLAIGKLPACVEASNGRIIFGDLNDPKSNVRKVLDKNFSIRRKPNLGTQPGVYYLI